MKIKEALQISKELHQKGGKAEKRLQDKCKWEHMSRSAVIMEWGDPRTWESEQCKSATDPRIESEVEPVIRKLMDVLRIEVENDDEGRIRTDCKLLPGLAPVGEGKTLPESLVVLFARVIAQTQWVDTVSVIHDALNAPV